MTPVATPEPLPMPTRARWQPLRLGLVELFRYDSEEFWFRDGHLLLRGNNGTGKSKVLSLSLPFLFDAQLKPSRLEPDGDPGKRMAWNLLMGSYDRRIGYTWLEFGRVDETSGEPRFLTLGAGLSAVSARTAVESWYFLVEGGPGVPRLNDGLWLTSAQRVTLTKERLREAIGQQGQVFESAQSYRRAVDERLFGLGEARYEALMDTLIQLRQPQLSKKPDEAALSDALTEALPPLAPELLADVAEALARLEEDRHQLEDFRALAKSVERFEQRYRVYAGAQSRRQARGLRQAQTEFDNDSRARNDAHVALAAARAAEAEATAALEAAELALDRRRARVQALIDDPANQDARRLDDAGREAMQRRDATRQAEAARDGARRRLETAVADADACAKRADAALRPPERSARPLGAPGRRGRASRRHRPAKPCWRSTWQRLRTFRPAMSSAPARCCRRRWRPGVTRCACCNAARPNSGRLAPSIGVASSCGTNARASSTRRRRRARPPMRQWSAKARP